jgi:hypothetical protein
MENAEINNIIKIVGLQYKKNYEDEDYSMTKDDVQEEINWQLSHLYDFCDAWGIWVEV